MLSIKSESVTGRLVHRNIDATLTVYQENDIYRFKCDCKRLRRLSHEPDADEIWVDHYPGRWIANLQKDARKLLKRTKLQAEKKRLPVSTNTTLEQKLRMLKEMRDSGVLTNAEYTQKRNQLLAEY